MGTLFLDEIGELSEDCQAKLLRVLENGTLPPGRARQGEMKADVRIIAATNRDLKQECLEGRFRKDLFFRLGAGDQACRRCASAARTSRRWSDHFLARLAVEYKRHGHGCRRRRWSGCRSTPGRATCGSCARCWRTPWP